MKKTAAILLAALLMLAGLTACAGRSSGSDEQSEADNTASLSVVTTIFPVYDWTRNIAGTDSTDADIRMLIDSGVDLHSFQPSAEDIMTISECDVFIYVGGESDEWAEDALEEAVNKDMVVIELIDALGDKAKEEEFVEGMQEEDEHEHEHDDEDEDEDEDE